ncbi:DsbC family protein [Sphingomonas sp. BIUV-7]|uniref:Thiol:disulfide interchange protein n=1 Tax=Sphingomonas natans TaxID=3063330 RepID=A0ABT8Y7W9_9SPHN|nr:DsbC family protein [Sphingomonas sp. BIUV-7]MDO6414414.1 DsbC family protein [Sphingomonas sp. BIUV-7]
MNGRITRLARDHMGKLGLGVAGVVGAALLYAGADAGARTGQLDTAAVSRAIAARLPKTKISRVDCDKLAGICEVTAGANVFYTDASARYLVIGRVYDMKTQQDLTAARLLELSPDALVRGSAHADAEDDGLEHPPTAPERRHNVDLGELPAAGAIRWGKPGGPKLVVFTDFHCGYCKAMSGELQKLGMSIEERPISILNSRAISEAVYCAKDPVAALHAAYNGEAPKRSPKCNTSGLDANEAFARKNGFDGTPVIVRANDGAVIDGYRAAPVLAWFAKGGAA